LAAKKIPAGTWVQIETVVLEAGNRAEHLPEDTKSHPLQMWVKGYLGEEAQIGDIVTIETIIGRHLQGKLIAENPPYKHNFGRALPELLSVGAELRNLIRMGEEK